MIMNDGAAPLKIMRDKAMRLCSQKEYNRSEILKKLFSWGCRQEDAQLIVNELVAQKFLDDGRYAAAYANDKFRFGKWGRIKISYMLKMKGIEESVIREALERINEEEYLKSLEEELHRKRKSMKTASFPEIRAKLFRFAASRGFESEIIYRVLENIR
ncbi:MAG: RecX family transcriptional regulator [Bacteroidales bacterium]|jgi:regulatory protein|nr:RecX family transcriptional regulator [Bacteroidales bacterium]